MGKSFRTDELNQSLLFPPSLHDWLPDNHLARFVADVVNALDLEAIYSSYSEKDGRGMSAYAPAMMVRVLLYGYATGVYSSRKMQSKTYDDVAFRFLSADEHPDHSTLAEFRKRHLTALAGLFLQALQLCAKAGLVKLGHVAIDGTKIKASASKHKAMSYGRMSETEQRLQQEVEALLKQAEKTEEDPAGQGGVGKGSCGKGRAGTRRRRSQACRSQGKGREDGQEAAWPRTANPRAGTGSTRRQGSAQLHRSGEPDHAGRGQQGKLPAGLQRTGGSGCNGTSNRGCGDHSTGQ